MPLRLGATLLLVAILHADSTATAQDRVAVIPRYQGPLSSTSARQAGAMNYDPVDGVVAWLTADTLVVGHYEQYSSADVYSSTCEGSGIYMVSVGGHGVRAVGVGKPACLAFAFGLSLPAFDAHTRSVFASVRLEPNNSQLFRVTLPRGPVDTLMTKCAVYADDPDVSADGRAIVFRGLCTDRKQDEWELYVSRIDGTGLHLVPGEAGSGAATPRWSADGRRIAYVRTSSSGGARRSEVAVVDVTGGGRRVLARGYEPAWSADGAWIAYVTSDTGGAPDREIHIIRPDGTGDRRVFRNQERTTFSRGWGPYPEGQPSGRLAWSPDGQWIAFSRRYDRGTSVWRVSVSTGELRHVTAPDP